MAAPPPASAAAEAATAAAFAGRWAERCRVPAVPIQGQRIYRLGRLQPPEGVPGRLRQARAEDEAGLVPWVVAFQNETSAGVQGDAEQLLRRRIADGRLWLWELEEPVSMAMATPPMAGSGRIGLVYTPPARRGHGYAAACVAGVSARSLATEAREVILYTELENPTSNGVYRRIGFEAVTEVLWYRFGS